MLEPDVWKFLVITLIKIFIIDVIVSLVKLIMCYAFSVNRDALFEQNYFRLTATADMDVNYGHCMLVV